MTKYKRGKLLKAVAVLIDVLCPLTATLTQFPVWIERSSEATVSGMFVILAFLSCLPFINQIKAYFKSPAAWSVWLVIFLLFIVMESIMQEMIAVSFVGLVSNLIGAVVYKYGVKLEKTNKE
jgi:hypothetical protein